MLLSEMSQFFVLPEEISLPQGKTPRRRAEIAIAVVIAVAFVANPCWSGLEDLARSGDWERVLAIAARRADQLPLNPTEAMIAARAARAVADPRAERHFLEIAVGATDDKLQ